MAKRSPQMTSDNAASVFKTKISESLPLLGFLNNSDKTDIWLFWKTISSAVKIAVNGKGDIVETQRRNLKSAKFTQGKQLDEYRLHNLDAAAITIYVPVKCSQKNSRKFRVLKLVNEQKIADYFETIHLEGDDSSFELVTNDNALDFCEFSELCNASCAPTDAKDNSFFDHVSCTEGQGTDDDLKAVTSFLHANEKLHSPLSPRDSCTEVISPKLENSKPIKKVWPVGRPTTRSSSGARVIKDKLPEGNVKNSSGKESKIHTSKDVSPNIKVQIDNSNLTLESMTFYPDVKQELQEETENVNITTVPVGDNVMHITHSLTSNSYEHQHDTHLTVIKSESSEQCSTSSDQIYPHVDFPDKTLEYRIHMNVPIVQSDPQTPEMNKESTLQMHSDMHINNQVDRPEFVSPTEVSLQCMAIDQISKQDLTRCQLMPRSASDIETIISALEEELKKTGSEIATISLTSEHDDVEEIPSSVGEVSMEDMQASYVDDSGQILEGQDIVEVQHVDNVIWTSEGEVQIIEPDHMLDEADPEESVVYEGQPVHAQYDVVEYEVLTDKKHKRGRKRKLKEDSISEKTSLVDRTCPMCHRVLNYASSMTAHMRIHTGIRPYSCGQCDRKFTTKANRDRHEATHVGLKPFQCTQCSKSFTEKRSLKIHMRTHTGERPFVCDVCSQSFTQKCTLLVHMDRHTNKKGHLCDLCGKAFRQKCQLDVHVKRHKRQALYPCHECSTKCYTKGDLVRHMIKHTGERPFQCKLCPRAFTRKQYLVDHENQHYDRKPYRCSVCSATFHDMGSCHRHLKKHKVDTDEGSDKSLEHSALLSSSDFHRILEGTQIGQILKLGDGSEAVIKAVVSESDGSTVYHITCLSNSDGKGNKISDEPDKPDEEDNPASASDTQTSVDIKDEK